MNYKQIYDTLISRAQSREVEGYVEKHHIIPKCLGGSDDISNIVKLTAREHFIAHQLLVKIFPNEHKLVYALRMMCASSSRHNRNNREYSWAKEKFSKIHSARFKGIGTGGGHRFSNGHSLSVGDKNGMYGKNHSNETKMLMSEKAKNRSDKTLDRMSEAAKNRNYTDTGKAALSARSTGARNNMYGKNHTADSKKLMSEKAKRREKHKCEFCGKYAQKSLYVRWHGKNCKHREEL